MLQEIGQLVTAVGVVLAWLSLRANHRQRRRQFEVIYVQRYWTLMDRLSPKAAGATAFSLTPEDRMVARLYLRLCEDELELRASGWISNRTWSIWQAGIDEQLKRRPFSIAWDEIHRANENLSPSDGEFQYLRGFRQRREYDPLAELPTWKRLARAVRPAP